MSENKDTSIAWEYHENTKHSEVSVRSSAHTLDFENKPSAFKTYLSLPKVQLPREFPSPKLNALRALVSSAEEDHLHSDASLEQPNPLALLAEVLFYSAGITRVIKHSTQKYYMRAAPATGALYPIELYLVCSDLVPDLKAGVYHFDPLEFSLTTIREGKFDAELSEATAFNDDVVRASATIVFTSLAWRNAWKYETRSYRHWFWDSGVIAANLLACAESEKISGSVVLGFEDNKISKLLSLDEGKEAPVALVPLSFRHQTSQEESDRIREDLDVTKQTPTVRVEYLPLSRSELDYPIIWKMNQGSQLANAVEVSNWVRSASSIPQKTPRPARSSVYKLEADHPNAGERPPLGEVILKRGSTRRFSSTAQVSFKQLSNVLHYSTRGIRADFLTLLPQTSEQIVPNSSTLIDIYMISNSVEGLPSGSYFFNRERHTLELLNAGEFRKLSAYLCLEQPLFGQASAVFFLMAHLEPILGYLGNRGYRAAQFEAGVTAGKIYLASYSVGLGASGSTFYDDAVTEFFSPHAEGKSTMIALGIGTPDYASRPGSVLVGKIEDDRSVAPCRIKVAETPLN